MPKPLPKKKKDNDEKILNEIAESVKKSKSKSTKSEEQEKKSDLEEEVEEDEENSLFEGNFDFRSTSPRGFSAEGSPVLEKVASQIQGPRFVNTSRRSVLDEEEEEQVRYTSSSGQNNEPKYAESSVHLYTEPENTDFSELGKKEERFRKIDDSGFRSDSRITHSEWTPETTFSAERFDESRFGRERREPKYEKYNPKRKN